MSMQRWPSITTSNPQSSGTARQGSGMELAESRCTSFRAMTASRTRRRRACWPPSKPRSGAAGPGRPRPGGIARRSALALGRGCRWRPSQYSNKTAWARGSRGPHAGGQRLREAVGDEREAITRGSGADDEAEASGKRARGEGSTADSGGAWVRPRQRANRIIVSATPPEPPAAAGASCRQVHLHEGEPRRGVDELSREVCPGP